MYNHHNQLLLKLQSQIPISLQKANILGNVVYNQDKLLVEWATWYNMPIYKSGDLAWRSHLFSLVTTAVADNLSNY